MNATIAMNIKFINGKYSSQNNTKEIAKCAHYVYFYFYISNIIK